MGQNKLLLPLGDKLIIEWVLNAVFAAGIEDVVVVTGHQAERLMPILQKYDVKIVDNKDYKNGQTTSIITGAKALNENSHACFFVMGDQPFLDDELLKAMIAAFESGDIIRPMVDGQMGTPVLFAAEYYPALRNLPAQHTGKLIIKQNPTAVRDFIWHDAKRFIDIDDPETYQMVKSLLI